MVEIASVGAGVSCFDVFSAMSLWREKIPNDVGATVVVISLPNALARKS